MGEAWQDMIAIQRHWRFTTIASRLDALMPSRQYGSGGSALMRDEAADLVR